MNAHRHINDAKQAPAPKRCLLRARITPLAPFATRRFSRAVGAVRRCALHYSCGAARRVRSHIPGALSILKGAVPDRARGLGHMAPTYLGREPGIESSDDRRGSALLLPRFSWTRFSSAHAALRPGILCR